MREGSNNAEIVRAIVSLGASLGKSVIAEGIETQSQFLLAGVVLDDDPAKARGESGLLGPKTRLLERRAARHRLKTPRQMQHAVTA